MSQLLLDITPDHHPNLLNFVVGHNLELWSSLAAALSPASSERIFYLWGEAGCGKSHLLQACVDEMQRQGQHAIYARGSVPEMADLVAVDDVELLDAQQQIALFNLFNQMRDSGLCLLIAGQVAPLFLSVRDDLRTRLGWGLVYQVQSLSDEEKIQALSQHAHERGFELTAEVAHYLLRHGRRDLPSLLSTLDALDKHSLRLKRTPSVPLLKEVLNQEKLS